MNISSRHILTLAITMIASLLFSGCSTLHAGKPKQDSTNNRPIKEISPTTAAKLMIDGKLPAVVFSVNRQGELQSYKIKGAKSTAFNFPLSAGKIKSVETITIFETTNPKTCWLGLSGARECIIW